MVERMAGSKSSNDIDDFVAAFLVEAYPSRTKAAEDRRAEWAEILGFSPKGFKFDTPSVSAFRRRLTALARGVATDIDG